MITCNEAGLSNIRVNKCSACPTKKVSGSKFEGSKSTKGIVVYMTIARRATVPALNAVTHQQSSEGHSDRRTEPRR